VHAKLCENAAALIGVGIGIGIERKPIVFGDKIFNGHRIVELDAQDVFLTISGVGIDPDSDSDPDPD
jgi:hypothetical protein